MRRQLSRDDVPVDCSEDVFPVPADDLALAELMYDAYRGTVDDEGETLEDAVHVIARLRDGEFGTLETDASSVVVENGVVVAATLVTIEGGSPLVAFSMTRPSHSGRGLARQGLRRATSRLAASGWDSVCLVVTVANTRAMGLYVSEGFAVVQ